MYICHVMEQNVCTQNMCLCYIVVRILIVLHYKTLSQILGDEN